MHDDGWVELVEGVAESLIETRSWPWLLVGLLTIGLVVILVVVYSGDNPCADYHCPTVAQVPQWHEGKCLCIEEASH